MKRCQRTPDLASSGKHERTENRHVGAVKHILRPCQQWTQPEAPAKDAAIPSLAPSGLCPLLQSNANRSSLPENLSGHTTALTPDRSSPDWQVYGGFLARGLPCSLCPPAWKQRVACPQRSKSAPCKATLKANTLRYVPDRSMVNSVDFGRWTGNRLRVVSALCRTPF